MMFLFSQNQFSVEGRLIALDLEDHYIQASFSATRWLSKKRVFPPTEGSKLAHYTIDTRVITLYKSPEEIGAYFKLTPEVVSFRGVEYSDFGIFSEANETDFSCGIKILENWDSFQNFMEGCWLEGHQHVPLVVSYTDDKD